MNGLKFMPQTQESECGLSCVVMLLNYFGTDLRPRDLKEYQDIGRDGISLQKAGEILRNYHLHVDFYEASYNRLDELLENPIMIHWNNNHFVILYKMSRNYFYLLDPALGKIKLNGKEFSKHYSGFALTASTTNQFSKVKSDKESNWSIYIKHFQNNSLRFILLFFISFLFSMTVLLVPSYIGMFVDYYETYRSVDIAYLISIFIIMSIFILLFYTRITYMLKATKNLDLDNYNVILEKLFSVPFKFYLTRSSSVILFRLGLLRSNREMLFDTIFKGILDTIVIIVVLLAIYIVHFETFLILLGISLVMAAFLELLRREIIIRNKKELNEYTKLQSLEYETFSSIFSIKANSQEAYMKNLLSLKNSDAIDSYVKKNNMNNIFTTITHMLNTFGPVLILLISLYISQDANLNIGLLIFIFTLSGIYFQNFSSIFNTLNTIGSLKNNILKINDILEQSDDTDYYGDQEIKSIEKVEFKNVSFKYPGQSESVVKNLSFTINVGEKVGFAGTTGSGKSTILGLVLGIYKPVEGDIYINDKNIKDIDLENYKNKIGFVPQEPYVYNKSIEDNITMNRDINNEKIIQALSISDLLSDISKMPLGIDTIISESGTNISGGQKQRIIIARAVANEPDLLIFDEATSSLDNRTEIKINENLLKLAQTQIIVAHRLSSIKKCDKIIFLKNNCIYGIGSYEELKEKNEDFNQFSSLGE